MPLLALPQISKKKRATLTQLSSAQAFDVLLAGVSVEVT